MASRVLNPADTVLKTFGRSHRDEPFHLVYSLVLYPKKSKIERTALADYLAVRYLNSRKKTGSRYRIETYLHKDGKRYVNRLLLESLTDNEKVELAMKFGTEFLRNKQIRTGLLRRPKLKPEEKRQLDAMRDQFYAEVARRRQEAAEAQRSLTF
jgi:hypothetical protein